ncbi:ATP-dependent exoDNAse (exonuclease V) beta subunit (contains helicase and exonuclease domains) [Nitrosospira sp. Nsp11]|uniref:UvrD-helicase domain-containing protein n=1 Tax=Nitrosospira sp. Nsp11 TaxID=1855338 RepID=UPI00092067F8|nr:UvrD-helicase domain-containing protein [Nitrosospira sp. Nsp11]SHL52332.1 ATP-dependent exoDNAse (exonuclease V) beta subunit (contains helicase and exonuclease domains) [Nitrosospira sp. Nsp11]
MSSTSPLFHTELAPHLASGPAPDFAERRRALDPAHSFIVQAPAGSGKTGLLIQRYLKLLTLVDEPEEIVAITFTRKAAAEMRERLMAALVQARDTSSYPSEMLQTEYERLTRELAVAVLQRDERAGWHILDSPARLRVQTFDSLCASLTRQMPVLSEFGSQPETIEDASDLYADAARATIGLVEGNDVVAQDVEHLLEHLDNDAARVAILLIGMLARRDHWLRHIHGKDRDELEGALKNARRDALRRLCSLFPASSRDELVELMRYSSRNLANSGKGSSVVDYAQLCELSTFPGDDEGDVPCWHAIAELLLVKEGAWRKRHTITEGFPPEPKARKAMADSWKDRVRALVTHLAEQDDSALCLALYDIREKLPPPAYTERQWQVLSSIMRLLPRAVAQLRLVFQAHNKVDFTEVAQGALRALGEPEMPTDLALALDYRIQHLLIDEFQDTSISQYDLVVKLTAGWEPGDGRSVLAVGDPMQSIYRFREAEVGLFLRARAEGIGNVALQPSALSANFRSQRGIVDWVNATFSQVMPEREDIALGAVSYAHSIATRSVLEGTGVSVHPFFNDDHAAEAVKVVEIVAQAQRDDPGSTTAILVRNRSHLGEIIPRLKEAGIRFRAIEIEGLARRPIVQDLLALTRALAHPGDRMAWLALLRAPWCGLTLADMHALVSVHSQPSIGDITDAVVSDTQADGRDSAAKPPDRTVWELINDDVCMASVSADGYIRLLRVRKVLVECMAHRCRQSLRDTVEAAWLALGGPACIEDATDFEDAAAYLDYLEANENESSVLTVVALEEGLVRLFALPDVKADDTLQIMTIHKAKGLEFDHVIVPGLGRSSRGNDKKLFMWMEYLRPALATEEPSEGNDLLLAPIQETGGEADRIYSWLEKLDGEKERLEDGRLLYVAATRAKQRLHLLGSAGVREGGGPFELKSPAGKTLLSKIWPMVEPIYAEAAAQAMSSGALFAADDKEPRATGEYAIDQSLRRLVSGWTLPAAPPSVQWRAQQQVSTIQGEIEYSWAGETARIIGNIVHRWLQRIAEDGVENWGSVKILELRDIFKRQFAAHGMSGNERDTDAAVKQVITALTHAVSDRRGQWLLGPQRDASNELRMTTIAEGEYIDLVIDRTFRDESGQRWVVDYKTSSHEGSDLEGFLDSEQERYRAQLDRYAVLMRSLDGQPVKRGLYFPILKGWREWGDTR